MVKIQMKTKTISIFAIIIIATLFVCGHSAAYAYSTCQATEYLNSANLACTACPTNQISNNYQNVAIGCQCLPGYRLPTDPNANACTSAFTTACSSVQYYPLLNIDGSATSGSVTCVACASTSYPNR